MSQIGRRTMLARAWMKEKGGEGKEEAVEWFREWRK